MSFWIKHPRSNSPDTMLTAAIAGFIFTTMFITAAFVASWIMKDPHYLDNIAMIAGAILTPSLGAYTARKFTDRKYSNVNENEQEIK